jgi:iron(III) transport system substrate-binding protein
MNAMLDVRIAGRRAGSLAALALALLAAACGGADSPGGEPPEGESAAPAPAPVTVYSGRNESLIGPILERFTEATGIPVEVRYGETAELAATLLEEGSNTPAEVFIAQDAAALGALAAEGLLRSLPSDVVSDVPARFADPGGRWVGLSGRARVLVYNTASTSPDELPATLEAVADPRYRGRFGVAPLNGSFQAQMAVYRALEGAEALEELLAGLAANRPQRYANNRAIVDAAIAGEIDFGLVNHYYLWRALQERPDAPAKNWFQPGGGASSFINVAGAGVLAAPADVDAAEAVELVRWLLSDEAQRYFAGETFEYPLVPGVPAAADLVPLDELATPDLDFGAVSAVLDETLAAIDASGLVGPG